MNWIVEQSKNSTIEEVKNDKISTLLYFSVGEGGGGVLAGGLGSKPIH